MPLNTITETAQGAKTRINPNKTATGGTIPTDPVEAGLGKGVSLSPDPTTAAAQLASLKVRT